MRCLAFRDVTLLMQDVEDSFSAKKRAGALFVYLTATYRSLWHRGLTCKLLRPDRHMVRRIMEMVGNCSFTFTTGNNKRSRLRRLNNGIPQGSVLTPLLLNICISDMPSTVSRKYAYVDHPAIRHADGHWQAVDGVLSRYMATIDKYLQIWNNLVAKAQHYKNSVGNLPPQQQGSQT